MILLRIEYKGSANVWMPLQHWRFMEDITFRDKKEALKRIEEELEIDRKYPKVKLQYRVAYVPREEE